MRWRVAPLLLRMRAWLLRLLAHLVPPTCPGCLTNLPALEPVSFCPGCFARMAWWNPDQTLPPKLHPAIATFTAPCLYDGPLREAILHLKFHDHTYLARPLAKLLLPLLPPRPNLLLVPVPSHWSRLHRRRYNHAALLAHALGRMAKLEVASTALKRLNKGLPQNTLTRAQRLRLSHRDFAACGAVEGRNVLLIDDIFTTGATARACALALKRAGAAEVHVLTLAYTAPH